MHRMDITTGGAEKLAGGFDAVGSSGSKRVVDRVGRAQLVEQAAALSELATSGDAAKLPRSIVR
jgi:hypothetical protein